MDEKPVNNCYECYNKDNKTPSCGQCDKRYYDSGKQKCSLFRQEVGSYDSCKNGSSFIYCNSRRMIVERPYDEAKYCSSKKARY